MYSAAMRDLKQLQSFRSTALAGSVRGAAERLATAPSAISHQIRALEAELGLELFTRDRRRLVLTPIGRELLIDVERVFESLGELEDRATELRDSRVRRLVIGYFSSAGARWMATLWPTSRTHTQTCPCVFSSRTAASSSTESTSSSSWPGTRSLLSPIDGI